MPTRIILLGPPGSGKGTQAVVVKRRLGVPHISTGDLLREAVKSGAECGEVARGYMASGSLVPDELVLTLVRERIVAEDCLTGFLFDGFPRTEYQASELEGILDGSSSPLDHVVELKVPEPELVARLNGRRGCSDCGRLYHTVFNPPVRADLCDDCGGVLELRDDDREDTIKKRLAVYREETLPLTEFYELRRLLRGVDGSGAPAEVCSRILTAVGSNDDRA